MAAIVSQLAAANRRRKANKKNHVPIEKCVYVLPPFDPCFKPEVHNRYIRHKQAHLAHQEFISRIGTLSPVHIHQLEKMGTQRMKSKKLLVPPPDSNLTEDEDILQRQQQLTEDKHHHQLLQFDQADDPEVAREHEEEVCSPTRLEAPKRGTTQVVTLNSPELQHSNLMAAAEQAAQVELKLLDEETLQVRDNETPHVTSLKCQLLIATLGLLALIPLIGIVVYLVGMFYGVPSTKIAST